MTEYDIHYISYLLIYTTVHTYIQYLYTDYIFRLLSYEEYEEYIRMGHNRGYVYDIWHIVI